MKKIFSIIITTFFPAITLAQDSSKTSISLKYSKHTDAVEFLLSLTDWLFTFSLVASVIAILIGAFMFTTGGGNPERIKTARKIIIWAVIGLAIIMLSRGIILLVDSIIKS